MSKKPNSSRQANKPIQQPSAILTAAAAVPVAEKESPPPFPPPPPPANWFERAAGSAAFSYLTIFLLQLKIIWGIGLYRDLTFGDTSSYFVQAVNWYRNGHVELLWSPLYTAFYGSLLYLSEDVYAVTTLHRVIIVLALALLVLALMRSLLPAAFAWAAAAWWVVLPINYDSLYEVHLFSVIPVLFVFLAMVWKPGPWGRGTAIGLLVIAGVLVRNELLLATGLFAIFCLAWEWKQVRDGAVQPWKTARAYLIPVIVSCLLLFLTILAIRTDTPIEESLKRKHTLNVCQIYAFGYQQRASDWKGSPWTECQALMQRDFGAPEPSFGEAMRLNPRAMWGHIWWNARLIPSGVQMLLLNRMTGTITPDYAPSITSIFALPASLIACAVTLLGLFLLIREREYWWREWLRDRMWVWIALACVSLVVVVVMLTQRPRPSYMLAMGIALRAAMAFCAYVVYRRWPAWPLSRFAAAGAVAASLLIILTPAQYIRNPMPRPLLQIYRRLSPFAAMLTAPNAVLVSPGYGGELCNYLGLSRCRSFTYADMRDQVTPAKPLPAVLAANGATLFYASEGVLTDPAAASFLSAAGDYGWQLVGLVDSGDRHWRVLRKAAEPAGAPPQAARAVREPNEITPPSRTIALGTGWHDLEHVGSDNFRWVDNDAEIRLLPEEAGSVVRLTVEAGPSLGGKPLALQVFHQQELLKTFRIVGRQEIAVPVPKNVRQLRLHTKSANKPIPNDPRILNFRVLKIWTE